MFRDKKKKIDVIIFTYKRAMNLDACIDSVIMNCRQINYPINIIYRNDSKHKKSYEYLKKIYNEKIKFHERKSENILKNISLLLHPLNLLWILKWHKIYKEYSNFKKIFENILKESKKEYIMLCTDDTVITKKIYLDNIILRLIKKNGKKYWFRSNFGLDLDSKKKFKFINKNITWNADDSNISYFMKYHFQVEGSIYNKQFLLEFVKPFIYYNPTTLEAIGFKEAGYRGYFKQMISPLKRSAFTVELNTVQQDTSLRKKERANFSTKWLMKLFLKGYRFRYKNNKQNMKTIFELGNKRFVPNKIYLNFKKTIVEFIK